MATTQTTYTGNGSTTNYSFTFPYLAETDVKVKLDGVTQATTTYSFANATTISMNTAPGNGVAIIIFRDTNNDSKKATFYPGSAIKAEDLNNDIDQILYVAQEVDNNAIDALGSSTMQANLNIGGHKLISVADPTAAQDAVTKAYLERTGSIQSAQIQDGTIVNADVNASAAIAGTKISPNFGSQNIVTSGTVDGRDVSADGIKLDSIETGATADQNAAEIRTLVESASDSNVFTDADHSKLNAIEANATADQTNAEIRAAVEAASDSNVFTDADHSKLNAIEANATADQTVSEIKSLIASSPLDDSHLAANSVGDSEIATGALDNRYYTETELNAGQLDNRYYTETESDARYFNISTGDTIKDGDTFPDNDTTIATTAAINDRIIDLVDDVGGFVPIANETSFPNANPDVNNGTGTIVSIGALAGNLTSNGSGVITIANGTVGNSTVTITGAANSTTYSAGYGLLVETTSTLNTYTFHRLSSKATEVSTVAGNISNINAVANNASNINSAVSNASNINSAVSNASNINSAVSNASNINTVAGNNTNINTVAGANSNITTVAGSISNVNTAAGSIANINTVATNINSVNDFSDVYRVASSAPSSHLHEGDLYFDTSANELKVYNGSAWQGGVTATGNLAGLGANTFTGHQSLGDNLKIQLGTGNDLQIYHDGSNSTIHNTTGYLALNSDTVTIRSVAQENGIVYNVNGSVDLYYDGSKKLATKSYGVQLYDDLQLEDNNKIRLGNAGDLDIYHDGTNSIIDNNTGQLRIQGDLVRLMNSAGSKVALEANVDGNVELYYNNSKKLETTSTGISVTSNINLPDSGTLYIGNDNDLELQHTGSAGTIKNATGTLKIFTDNLRIKDKDDGDNHIVANHDGSVELYYDGVKQINTTSTGVTLGDSKRIDFGDGTDLKIYHDGNNSYIADAGTGDLNITSSRVQILNAAVNEYIAKFAENGAVELYYDNSKKFETHTSGINVTGRVLASGTGGYGYLADDNVKIGIGTGKDLQIYHDGTHSYINEGGAGSLLIQAQNFMVQNPAGNENMINAVPDGTVELYYDNSKKLETTSSGVAITGVLSSNQTSGQAISLGDNAQINFGNGDDLQIYHDGGSSIIRNTNNSASLYLQASSGGTNNIRCYPNAGVVLYWNGETNLYTAEDAVRINDNVKLLLGNASDLQIYHNGSHNYIVGASGQNTYIGATNGEIQLQPVFGSQHGLRVINGGAVEAYYDGSKKFETTSSGVQVHGQIQHNDNVVARYGNDGDLQVFHDGSNSRVSDRGGSGDLWLESNGTVSIKQNDGNEYMAQFTVNGACQLRYDHSIKLATTASGVSVTGTVSDSKGNLRSIPLNTQSSAYTLVAADAGKTILASGNITIADSIFSAGDAVTIINNTNGDITINKGSVLYYTVDGTSANRTLATRGMATIYFTHHTTGYISGAGLS